MNAPVNNPSVTAVAMSGGVDSSTVAALLHARSEPIVGLTMQLWDQRRLPGLQGVGPAFPASKYRKVERRKWKAVTLIASTRKQ